MALPNLGPQDTLVHERLERQLDQLQHEVGDTPITGLLPVTVVHSKASDALHIFLEIAMVLTGHAPSRNSKATLVTTASHAMVFTNNAPFRTKWKLESTHPLSALGPVRRDGKRSIFEVGEHRFSIGRDDFIAHYEAIRDPSRSLPTSA